MKRLGVVIALKEEAEAILSDSLLDFKEMGQDFYVSSRKPIEVCVSGAGKAFAAFAAGRLLQRCDFLCAMGTAGIIAEEKGGLGRLFFCEEFVERDMRATGLGNPVGVTPFERMPDPVIRSCTPEIAASVKEALDRAGIRYSTARIATSDSFVANAAEARAIRLETGALLVDMESAAVAKVCALRARVPFFSIRSVSDAADGDAELSWAALVREGSISLATCLRAIAK